jgi:Calcineurin-like phosphoesterase
MPVSSSQAETIVALFEQAREANFNTSYRRGHVIELTAKHADDVLITADLHGDCLNFDRLVALADLEKNPRRHLLLQEICHGGPKYPGDAGCMSHLLLEDVAQLKTEYPDQVHFLLSNHELSEATEYPVAKGGKVLNLAFRLGLQTLYGDMADSIYVALRRFLRSCPVAARLNGNIFISHSLPSRCDSNLPNLDVLEREWEEADLIPGGTIYRMVWGRDFRRDNAAAFAQEVGAEILIHGHEPCMDGYQVPNDLQIILDSSGPNASYILLPLSQSLTQDNVIDAIARLHK